MARIVVTPAEEDEVIVAGGRADEAPGVGGRADVAPDSAAPADEAPAVADAAPEPAPSPQPPSAAASRETTLDDLESSPMPLAQRVVIVAAVVCIIGALVYYFVAMR